MPLAAATREILRAEGGFADAGRPENQRACAHRHAIVEQRVDLRQAALERLLRQRTALAPVLQPRKDAHAAGLNPEVVESADVGHTAQLDDFEPPARDAEIVHRLLEADDAVREALDVRVGVADAGLVQQQQRAATPDEKLLQAENLAPVAQRVSCQQPHVRHRVEHRARRLELFDRLEHVPR